MDIRNHKLTGTGVSFKPSPNHGGTFGAGSPDTIVIHYTAGASLESSVATLCDPASKASAHIVVGRDGRVVQLVPFNTIAWHAGASTHGARTGLNKFSIGIEIDNAGRLTQTASGDFLTWFSRRVPKKDAIQGVHRNETVPSWWHAYTEVQIARVFEITALLVNTYPIAFIVGHEEISPGRKSDPGPAFPLERLRDRLLGSARQEDAPAAMTVTPAIPAAAGPPDVLIPEAAVRALATATSLATAGGVGKPTSGGTGKPGSGGRGKPGTGGRGKSFGRSAVGSRNRPRRERSHGSC